MMQSSAFQAIERTSPTSRALEAALCQLATTELPILLLGEAGSGKHTTAKRIHHLSCLSDGQFVPLSSENLDAEELIRPGGYLTLRGTLYFEELVYLSSRCQEVLHTWLADKGTEKDGGGPRLIFGSSQDLYVGVRSGHLNDEIFSLISSVTLHIAPLRHRKLDIALLTDFFLYHYAQEFSRPVPLLSQQTRDLFASYHWPGNIAELAEAIRAIVAVGDESLAMGGLRSVLCRDRNPRHERVSLREAARLASRDAERELILGTLNRTRWNRRRAAEELNISYKALLYKLKQIGFDQSEAS
jgi:two-component system response regulator AtoC